MRSSQNDCSTKDPCQPQITYLHWKYCNYCTTVSFWPSVQSQVTGLREHLIRWIFESFGSSPVKNEYFWYLSQPKFHPWTLPGNVHKCHTSHPMNTWSKWYSTSSNSYISYKVPPSTTLISPQWAGCMMMLSSAVGNSGAWAWNPNI